MSGSVTRPPEDFDWVLPRRELEVRKAQAGELGFSGFETWGEAAPGEPFYLFAEGGELRLDLGIAEEEGGALWMKVHRLFFEIGGGEAPSESQRESARLLRERFLSNHSEDDLEPLIERLR